MFEVVEYQGSGCVLSSPVACTGSHLMYIRTTAPQHGLQGVEADAYLSLDITHHLFLVLLANGHSTHPHYSMLAGLLVVRTDKLDLGSR